LSSSPTRLQVNLQYADPQAVSVFVAGTFNDWNAYSHALRKVGPREWCLQMMLKPGRYEYRLVVDGEWKQDPSATASVPNPYGGFNSVFVVERG
jgi:1,4-alpha-glucan branching enzyme